MKFTVHFTHEVQKHANKEGSLTGRSQKTPCTDQNWFAPTKCPPTIQKGWKQSIFISGCFTQSSSSRIQFLKIAISTKRLFFNRVHWESSELRVNYRRSKRIRFERLSTLRPCLTPPPNLSQPLQKAWDGETDNCIYKRRWPTLTLHSLCLSLIITPFVKNLGWEKIRKWKLFQAPAVEIRNWNIRRLNFNFCQCLTEGKMLL